MKMTTQIKKEKTVIIIGAGLLVVPAIKIAREMGLKTIVTDWNKNAPGFEFADIPVIISTKDVEANVKIAKEMSKKHNIVGVFTVGADVEYTVACIAEALGLISVSPEVALKCNNKAMTRKALEEAGIPGPAYKKVCSIKEALEFSNKIGFPIVVKPLDNCASRGIKKVYNEKELKEALQSAKNFNIKNSESVLLEEYLEGPKQTVEMLVYNNTFHLCSIIDTHYGFDPYPIETGHNNPTKLPKKTQEELFKFGEKVSRAIGINIGAAKVDTILTKKGPMVIEMTARLSGGFHCQYTTPLALGTNDIKAAIDIAIGNPLNIEDITPKFHRWAICRAIFPKPGVVKAITGLEEAKKIRGVQHIFLLTKEGEIIKPYSNCGDRVCFIITSGETFEEAEESFNQAKKTLKILTENEKADEKT